MLHFPCPWLVFLGLQNLSSGILPTTPSLDTLGLLLCNPPELPQCLCFAFDPVDGRFIYIAVANISLSPCSAFVSAVPVQCLAQETHKGF